MILQYVYNTGIQYFVWVLQHTLTGRQLPPPAPLPLAASLLPNEFFAVGSRVRNQSFCMINCLIMANLIYITELPIQEVFACLHYL